MKTALVLVLVLATTQSVAADSIVVLGKLVYNEPMEYVPSECPENYICLRSWWKSVVNVQKTIHGSPLSGRIAAAVMQHTSYNARYKKSVHLFVLKPIEDPAARAKLRVDYYLEDMSEGRQMYCLSQDPKEAGLEVDETYVAGTDESRNYCFELPEG
jgi:hypothetical protein